METTYGSLSSGLLVFFRMELGPFPVEQFQSAAYLDEVNTHKTRLFILKRHLN